MRYEVVVDGQSIGKHEFRNTPVAGDSVETAQGVAVVKRMSHTLSNAKAVVVCETDPKVKASVPLTFESPTAKATPEPIQASATVETPPESTEASESEQSEDSKEESDSTSHIRRGRKRRN